MGVTGVKVGGEQAHEPAEGRLQPPLAPALGRVLELQRSAGNQAVLHALGARASRQRLDRYEAGEHAQFGGARKYTINGVELTEGQVIALAGDLYGSWDDMRKADKKELEALRDLVKRDTEHYAGKAGVAAVGNPEWQAATLGRPAGKRYMDLAKVNDTHFAPPAAGGVGPHGDNKSEWEKLYRQAIDIVKSSAKGGKPGVPDEAGALAAFAAHYLTDAFSAGHIVNKDDAMAKARTVWATQKFDGWVFKESDFTRNVAALVLADKVAGAKLKAKELDMVEWGEVSKERFSEFIYQMAVKKPDLFFNAFARLIHDKLNQAIKDPKTQFEVTNRKGDTWILAGDETLGTSVARGDTLKIARKAVEASYQGLEAVAKDPTIDPAKLVKDVWDYTPEPTAAGKKVLKDFVDTYTDPKRAETVTAFAQLAIVQIDTLIDQLTSEGYMRDKPKPAPRKPQPAPRWR